MICFLFYLDSIPEIYIDNFFEVACKIKKNQWSGHVSLHFENEPHKKMVKKHWTRFKMP